MTFKRDSSERERNSVLDYSTWDNTIVVSEESPGTPFSDSSTNTSDNEQRKIPRSPRPAPIDIPITLDQLLEPPPPNAPKGAAAVRHYQIGFGRKIIPKKRKPSKDSSHKKSFSVPILDDFILDESNITQTNTNNNTYDDSIEKISKKFGIRIDSEEEQKEVNDLFSYIMNIKQNMNPKHHDFYRHNPNAYHQHQKRKSHSPQQSFSDIPKVDAILKLGGSFLTNKQEIHSLNTENISIAAKHISDAFNSKFIMILIHGAGSFGHFEVKEYKLIHGLHHHSESVQGMVLARAAVSVLHQHLLAKLIEMNIPVVSVSPNALVTSTNHCISRRQFRSFVIHIGRILKQGMVPLIHGDVIFDDKSGCSILSGDTILENLCSAFIPQRAIFWSNIRGVYDCTSLLKERRIISQINVSAQGLPLLNKMLIKQLKNPLEYYQLLQEKMVDDESGEDGILSVDTTGGIWKKIEVSCRCCAQGVDVTITKGGSEDALLALLGKYCENATVFVSQISD